MIGSTYNKFTISYASKRFDQQKVYMMPSPRKDYRAGVKPMERLTPVSLQIAETESQIRARLLNEFSYVRPSAPLYPEIDLSSYPLTDE